MLRQESWQTRPIIPSPRQTGRVALLGFAHRRILVKFTPKAIRQCSAKPLPTSVKTISDWILVKRHEKGLARFHIAVKMGIATRVVKAWEEGITRPDARQLKVLVAFLGQYRRTRNFHAISITPVRSAAH
jgi:ribosome-binding protein aMBF1 (putative translation factor)